MELKNAVVKKYKIYTLKLILHTIYDSQQNLKHNSMFSEYDLRMFMRIFYL